MKSVKIIFLVCLQNIRKWHKDYRILTIAVLILIMINIYLDDFHDLCENLHSEMPIWIFPFIYQQYYMKVIFTVPIILLFCNAPFIDNNQIYVLLRTGKCKFIAGQIFYIFVSSAIYYIFIIISVFILIVFKSPEYSMKWGKVLKTIAETDISSIGNYPFIEVSDMVIRCFTPVQAVLFTFLTSWSNAVMIGIIIFSCNYLLKNKYVGSIITSFDIVFSFFVEIGGYPKLINYSPTSWITLDKIDIGYMTEYPTFRYCMSFYWITIAVLLFFNFAFGRKIEIDIRR